MFQTQIVPSREVEMISILSLKSCLLMLQLLALNTWMEVTTAECPSNIYKVHPVLSDAMLIIDPVA